MVSESIDSSETAVETDTGFSAYRRVLQAPGMRAWTLVVLCQRLPIAMAPLALVLLGHAVTGSFATGALLGGVFAFAEAAFAGVMGRRFDRGNLRSEVRLVLGVQCVALAALAAAGSVGSVPVAVLIALSIVAGGVASGAHGGLRAVLVKSVPESAHQAALSLESTLTTLLWAVGPAIVSGLAIISGPVSPVVLIAIIAGSGVLFAGALRISSDSRTNTSSRESRGSTEAVWSKIWPALIHEGSVMLCVGAAYSTLPALLAAVGTSSDLAGPILAAFAISGIVGGLVYGSRKWPGTYPAQTLILICVLVLVVGAASLSGSAVAIAALIIASGLAGTPALTARAAGVQKMVDESVWSTAFSGLYAAGGVGFGVAGLLSAALLDSTSAGTALLACAGIAGVLSVFAGAIEINSKRLVQTD